MGLFCGRSNLSVRPLSIQFDLLRRIFGFDDEDSTWTDSNMIDVQRVGVWRFSDGEFEVVGEAPPRSEPLQQVAGPALSLRSYYPGPPPRTPLRATRAHTVNVAITEMMTVAYVSYQLAPEC